ncbi:MAG: hypothetical protein IKR04_04060 [Clostridia bacterium]|nr:hypothetical protein [Clostridia bacterium]
MGDNRSFVFNNNDFSTLLNKPEIREIIINNLEVTSDDLNVINRHGKIEIINFNFCNIVDDNISFVAPLNQLILAYTTVDLNAINGLYSLKELEIVNDEEDEVEIDINELLKFKNLETLRIYNSKVINAKELNSFQNLKELYLDGSIVDEKDLASILGDNISISHNEEYLFN